MIDGIQAFAFDGFILLLIAMFTGWRDDRAVASGDVE